MKRKALWVCLAIAMAAVGCGGATDETGTNTELGALTLEEVLGIPADSSPASLLDEVNEQIITCMKLQGFDYTPMSFGQQQTFVGSPMLHDDPLESARTNGFGITTRVESGSIALTASDPNAEMLTSMSAEEVEAWGLALEGDLTSETRPDACTQRAQTDVFGRFDRLASLAPELDELDAAISSDPRIVQFEADWQTCVAERGFAFVSPAEMIESLMADLAIDGFEIGSLEPPSADELSEIRSREVALAVADAECTIELGNVPLEVQQEHEREFVRDNYDALRE